MPGGAVGKVKGYLSDSEVRYLFRQLVDHDPSNKRLGLQQLCKSCRAGIFPRDIPAMRQVVLGAIYDPNPKVRRWVLNALAQIGSKENIEAIVDAIGRDVADPDILSSGIAALFSIERLSVVEKIMEKQGLALEGAALLAGAQASPDLADRVRVTRVNVDTASDAELRLALVLVGLNKAPPNTFSIKHPNGEIVGALNLHHEKTVAQYSVWAISENKTLGLKDMRVPLTDIESLANNVRGWIYRLIAERADTAMKHIEYLQLGTEDADRDARRSLSIGMAKTYFDGLEEITLDWLPREQDDGVHQRILEHMAYAVDQCELYSEPVLHAYKAAGAQSLLRARVEAAAQKTSLYRKIKLIEFEADEPGLFGTIQSDGAKTVVNQNFHGNVGNVTGSGNIYVQTMQVVGSSSGGDDLKNLLSKIAIAIDTGNLEEGSKQIGQGLVQEAAKTPSKGTLATLVSWLKGTKEALSFVSEAGDSFDGVMDHLGTLMDFFL